MTDKIQAYQHALAVWDRFHAGSRGIRFDEDSLTRNNFPESQLEEFLRLLPAGERIPVAFGCYIRFAGKWSSLRQSLFLGEFLPAPSTMERRILEAASKGALKAPRKLPVTVDEFPSRFWKRAQMKQCPRQLVSAACQSFDSMIRLHEPDEEHPDLQGENTVTVESGDVPDFLDLIALTPGGLKDLHGVIIDRMMEEVFSDRVQYSKETMESIKAWIVLKTPEGPDFARNLAASAREQMTNYLMDGALYRRHHIRRLGRLMFRLGLRRLSSQCAKVIRISPWSSGWQFQTIAGAVHLRIRQLILRPDSDADAWMKEPALACSAMTVPLWLMDGQPRISELAALFNRADECPWIFPRLAHVYQWHLVLAGRHEELAHIEQIAPDHAVGLSKKPELTNQ